jgi:hypothetical protein
VTALIGDPGGINAPIACWRAEFVLPSQLRAAAWSITSWPADSVSSSCPGRWPTWRAQVGAAVPARAAANQSWIDRRTPTLLAAAPLAAADDAYGGVLVDAEALPADAGEFQDALERSLQVSRDPP